MFTGEIFDEIKEWRAEWVADHVAHGRSLERETRPLKEVLRDLEAEFSRLDARIPQLFNPGLSIEDIQTLTQEEKWPVSSELAALYQWRNGASSYESYGLNGLFGPYCVFNSLQDALAKSKQMVGVTPDYYLEIMSDGAGGWVEVDLRPDGGLRGLVYELYKEEQDSPVIFPGLNAFFGAFLACLRKGAYRVAPKSGKNGQDLLVGHHQLIQATLARFSLRLPGEIREDEPVDISTDPDDGDGISFYDYQITLPPE